MGLNKHGVSVGKPTKIRLKYKHIAEELNKIVIFIEEFTRFYFFLIPLHRQLGSRDFYLSKAWLSSEFNDMALSNR